MSSFSDINGQGRGLDAGKIQPREEINIEALAVDFTIASILEKWSRP